MLDQPHPHVYFYQIGQEQSSQLVPRMRGSDIYERMRKFVTEGVLNHPNLGINFVTRFVRPCVASCHSICSCINIHHLEKSVYSPSLGICEMSGQLEHYKCVVAMVMFNDITFYDRSL